MVGELLIMAVLIQSVVLTFQGILTLMWMLYAWENPSKAASHESPKEYIKPELSFTAIVPARHEEKVIIDTITAIHHIDYPSKLKETIVVCTEDDQATIQAAQSTIDHLKATNARVLVLGKHVRKTKPYNLNRGLEAASGDIVTIFDSEDEPHPEIYNIINTVMTKERVDVVQSGVQLMNHNSKWFSTFNVLEYFLWFKSGLLFFTNVGGVSPLGGNTVFFKRVWLNYVDGWDEDGLTEDADIGFRLAVAGAKTKVIYDERHVTQEESPGNLGVFIKQRTRWHQGFLQIFFKGDWLKLPTTRQKLTALYVLLAPLIPTFLMTYMPLGIWIAASRKLPVVVSMISYVPLFILVLIITTMLVALYEFTKAYKLRLGFWIPVRFVLSFLPYVFLLTLASFRAFSRIASNNYGWEKTLHLGLHRDTAKSIQT